MINKINGNNYIESQYFQIVYQDLINFRNNLDAFNVEIVKVNKNN